MNAPRPNCPENDVLQELAAGILAPAMAQQTMLHVAECPSCGPTLRQYLREFSEEQSPENIAILKQLQSSKPGWQKKLVRQLIGGVPPFRWLKLVPATVALAAVIFGFVEGPTLWAEFQLRQAKKAVATAFVVKRTTAMRLTSVDYSKYDPFLHVMGAEDGRSVDEVPAPLHDASSAANKNLQAKNAKPEWLQIQGRALLWESTPSSLDKATRDFEIARSEGLTTPSLEIDLAASYFELDSRAERPKLERTLNLLKGVLSQPNLSKEDHASALFNLAIAYEKTEAWDMAVETWNKYLQVDNSSRWADEARQHLKDAQTRLHSDRPVRNSDPEAFLKLSSNPGIGDEVEEYQDIAISTWLPDAVETGNPNSLEAVRKLGDLLTSQHSDPWMSNLVSSVGPKDKAAIEALANAFKKNGQGDHRGALEEAVTAANIFSQHKNFSGEFRARLEEVNAFRRELNGADCLVRADPLNIRLSKTNYHWLQGQLSLLKAECGNLVGGFAESDSDLNTSREIADNFDFPVLVLRDIGMSAGNEHLRGNCDESWTKSVDGLNLYWKQVQAPRIGLFQFYSVMYQCALETGSLYAGEALLRHAIELRQRSPDIKKNPIIEATLHFHLANVLAARKANQEAEQEKRIGDAILGAKPLPAQYDLIIKLQPAEFELDKGDARRALAALEPLRPALANKPDKFFSLRFNQTLGKTYYKLGRLDDAAEAYKAAIHTAESTLIKIKDGNEKLLWLRVTDESYRGLVRVLLEQKKDQEALSRWEIYRSRPMLHEQIGKAAQRAGPTVKAVSMGPPKQPSTAAMPETRLVYADFNDGLQIWVSRNGSVTSRWVEIEKKDLENITHEFTEKCAVEDSKLEELHALGTRLFSLLLLPILPDIASSKVIVIESDRNAYNLPMEALTSPEGWYFGEKFAVIYSPGILVEKNLRSASQVTGQESLLLLDASHVLGAGYLPGLEAQKATITRLFLRTKIIDSAKTSWGEVRPQLASAQILHYMGHGKPNGSGTVLDYDGNRMLQTKDFEPNLLKHLGIAVLAACSGAAGRDNGIADTNNLTRAFLAAGVPAVIASHWNVDSSSTSDLMISFYRHLNKNESTAQAMYNARNELLQMKAHPYFWAGFTLAGRVN